MKAGKTQSNPGSAILELIAGEAGGGIILMASAALALILANSSLAPAYFGILSSYVGGMRVLHWINDALMALFFLLVGLEIKRELLEGELRKWSDRVLPGMGALGGMIGPALIFSAINWRNPEMLSGWAIPTATDIAFALGILSLLGSRVPLAVKVLLTALAIIDDLAAVVIIALFYTAQLSPPMLGAAAIAVLALVMLNKFGVKALLPYMLLGAVLWYFLLRSGVHPTIAGVILGMTIPLGATPGNEAEDDAPLHKLEHGLHPWSAYLVVPVFGFANAGVSLSGLTMDALLHPVTMGVALGLFVGKQLGVFGLMKLAIWSGIARPPAGANAIQLYGMSLLCGIGFTMSLFIGALAFHDNSALESATKIGVLLGSSAAIITGASLMLFGARQRANSAI